MPKFSKLVHELARVRSLRGGGRKNSSPRLAGIAKEVLAKNAEEAKDLVFYDALRKISADSMPPQDLDKSPWRQRSRVKKTDETQRKGISVSTTENEDESDDSKVEKDNNNSSTSSRRKKSRHSSKNDNNNGTPRLRRSGTVSGVPVAALLEEERAEATVPKDSAPAKRRYSLSSLFRVLPFGPAAEKLSNLTDLIIDPEGNGNYTWMGVLSLAVFYNFFVVILRIAFAEMRDKTWFRLVDLVADSLYALDIGVQLRTAYHDEHGILVEDPSKMMTNYMKQKHFMPDLLAVLPLETILRFTTDPFTSLLCRVLRLLKLRCVVRFFFLSDYRTNRPNRLRVLKLVLYLSIALHWVACGYYMISEYEGLGTNDWVYTQSDALDDGFVRKYIKSFYWSVLTLTTIGETPNPSTNLEYIFTGSMFLLGIFVFATVVGNVGDVISNMNESRTDFQSRMDAIKQYMEYHRVPDSVQNRVNRWAYYAWTRTQALDEGASLGMLPERLRAEISIHVHLATLKKVKIFKDCEQGLLCELVLKLRRQIFSPGDYICRCGEIGRDMYIINHGKVEVVVENNATKEEIVVASLSEGNYFGEISLLRLNGGRNRRSADVRSVGYSELLCLSQKDLMEALEEYPDAKKVLESQGKDRLHRTRSVDQLFAPPSEKLPKHDELQLNVVREIKEMRNLLEEMRETMEQQAAEKTTKEAPRESEVQADPPSRADSQPGPEPSLRSSQTLRQPALGTAEVLYQRLLTAARSASENSKETRPRPSRKSVAVDGRLARSRKLPRKEQRDTPEIFVENDVDGLCQVSGSRKVSMPVMTRFRSRKSIECS